MLPKVLCIGNSLRMTCPYMDGQSQLVACYVVSSFVALDGDCQIAARRVELHAVHFEEPLWDCHIEYSDEDSGLALDGVKSFK